MTNDWLIYGLAAAVIVLLVALAALWRLIDHRLRQGETEARQREEMDANLQQSRQETLLARMGEMLEHKQRLLSDSLHDCISVEQKRLGETMQLSLKHTTDTLDKRFHDLSQLAERKLDSISGRVDERLSQGFEKTQKVFADVLIRLAVIDKAQERIAKLSENVVSLQDVLADKRARGAFGEVQLNHLVRQALPANAYAFQATLSNGRRADCLLKLPDPVGNIVIDAKFPLENFQRLMDPHIGEGERNQAMGRFKQDVKKHIDDIASRYIIAGETSDGAIMFLPSEAVFAELYAHHTELIATAQQRHVWIASPTTMMAILTTVAAVLKDAETRKQVHIIREHLSRLAEDFERFGQRFDKLATHIRQAHEDSEKIHTSAKKIRGRFAKIERVELDEGGVPPVQADDSH